MESVGKEMNEKRRAGQESVIDESEGVNKRQTVRTNESPGNNEVLQRSANTATHTNIRYQLLVVLLSPNTHTHTHSRAERITFAQTSCLDWPMGEECVCVC